MCRGAQNDGMDNLKESLTACLHKDQQSKVSMSFISILAALPMSIFSIVAVVTPAITAQLYILEQIGYKKPPISG